MFVLHVPIHVDSSMEFNVLAISIGSTAGALVIIVLCVVVVAGKLLIYSYIYMWLRIIICLQIKDS